MAFSVGELDERVTIRRVTETQDEYGTLQETVTDLGPYWAIARPMSGKERDFADTTEAIADHKFVFRYEVQKENTITEDDTLVWRGVEFNIRFIKDHGPRHQYIEIDAERGVAI